MTNQKEATYTAIITALANAGIDFKSGQDCKKVLTPEARTAAKNTLFVMSRNGEIDYTKEFKDTKLHSDVELKKYCAGLVSNWTKKDPRLNGNVKYAIKDPGSRAGQSDPVVKALKSLIAQLEKSEDKSGLKEAKESLAQKQAELKAEKAAKNNIINAEIIPESLRHLIPKN